ncbi:MAG: peptide chain release factor 1 [Candidatus Saelkia tenebricola]|nr:peptide chain release factor 1 [Candidatus Saelkia tenebricola]
MKEEFKAALKQIQDQYEDIIQKLSCIEIVSSYELCQDYSKQKSIYEPVISLANFLALKEKELEDVSTMISKGNADDEFKILASEEKESLEKEVEKISRNLEGLILKTLLPREKYKNVIVEIRAGTGGDEAALFVGDLYKMYTYFAQRQGWKDEVMDAKPTNLGGFKEIIFSLSGADAYQKMKYENGVHRVQRVPSTETGGRIHTSAVSVVILPEPEEVEIEIDSRDLKIDTFRSSGAGGQHVNVTDSAVRITHTPTGIVVSCQDERSQIKNRQKAMRVLKARLLDAKKRSEEKKRSQLRRESVGSGDRSEKIRTYNFSDGRVTEHRINLTLYKLEQILNGYLDELIDALIMEDTKYFLQSMQVKDED